MKKDFEIKNYRLKYKRYYGIEFDENYEVHHLDGNRNNNDISNLLLLPKELHTRYHYHLQKLDINNNKRISQVPLYTRVDDTFNNHKNIIDFLNVIAECQKWVMKKEMLDYEINHREGVI